ncbi:hypothetical protein EIK77_010244 [Talaromyces pinophilus]|nr:hypothetical protein EIK77_010244 [Talaromyces pinophilus]PCG88748.1 Zinc finger, C2H2 [Penicillium occitanis (nom. inval.)]PCG90748.1 hypothetical protein PENOC_100590 [Penicillium occitanis (nom. inval.)]
MEGNNDPFIFGPDASTDMETLHAIHYANSNNNGAYNPNNPHEISTAPCYLDAPTTASDDAVTAWSDLQLSLNGISPPTSSQSSVAHEGSMFQEAFLSHHNSQVSNLTLAIEGMNNTAGLFDAIPASTSGSDELALNPPYIDDKPARMTKQSLRALKDWKAQHGEAVRPTKQQIHRLQRRTNLSPEQILNWFTHTKRRAETFGHSHSQQLGTLSQDFSASNATGVAMERPATPAVRDIIYAPSTPLGDMDPMERWENSPPEHEAALFSDIAKALSHSPLTTAAVPNKSQTSTRSASRADDSASTRSSINGYHPNPSTSSLDSIVWSDHSGASAQSGRSDPKPEYRRRARKRRTNPLSRGLNLNSLRSNNVPKTFQCTFCTDSFKTKYDWSRHEKSLHLALESWTCSPFGAVSHEDNEEEPTCVYCNTPSPTEDHLHTHRYLACDGRPESERTYYRKDHLRQHLRLVHGCRFIPSMEKWKYTPEFVRSRCGFCDKLLSTWQARIDHLAAHFRSGASMAAWVGGWGFEPHISRLVENGIPPFLIHQERNTVAPFTGSISLSKRQPSTAKIGNENDADRAEEEEKPYINQYSYPATGEGSWYDCFETQLATYINTVIATEGRIPSDKEIQDQGRRFVFDDDDPWHQTIAENVKWLEYFKERHGFVAQSLI